MYRKIKFATIALLFMMTSAFAQKSTTQTAKVTSINWEKKIVYVESETDSLPANFSNLCDNCTASREYYDQDHKCECKDASGNVTKKAPHCTEYKCLTTGVYCYTRCESCYNVCK